VYAPSPSREGKELLDDAAITGVPDSGASCYFLTTTLSMEAFMAKTDLATLSSKFQISIPKAVRTARQWHPGQVFAFIPKGDGMLLVPVPRREDLSGLASGVKAGDYRDRTDRT
jgi:AbrB family looped-hinge helix DNA binding protein